VDVAILAEPPHFRPMHIEACVEAGVHLFAEKPMAVDWPWMPQGSGECWPPGRKRAKRTSVS
jgi:hypothetical protein